MNLHNELYPEQTAKAGFWHRFREHVDFNKNVAIATAGGVLVSMGAAEIAEYIQNDPNVVAYTASISEFIGFSSIFVPLHYRSQSHKYKDDKTNKTNWKKFWKDMGKVYVAAIPSMLVFYPIFTFSNAYMLNRGVRPWMSTLGSYIAAYVPSQTLMTYIADKFGLLNQNREVAQKSRVEKTL